MEYKKLWQSKTLWVNLIAILAMVAQTQLGFVIDPENQLVILGLINTVLRLITKEPLDWTISKEPGFARPGLLLFIVFALLLAFTLCFTGCASTGAKESPQSVAAKALLASRQGIVAAATTADALCTQGVMKQAECDKAAGIYQQAQLAWTTAADGFLVFIQTGEANSYNQAMPRLMALTMDMEALLQSFRRGEK